MKIPLTKDTLQELINVATSGFVTYAPKIVLAILFFIIGQFIARLISKGLSALMHRSKIDLTAIHFFEKLTFYALLVIICVTILTSLGVHTTSLLAVLGTLGLTAGLALKDSLSNFASGVILIFLRPFKRGDLVTIADETGTIQEVTLFNTIIATIDNKEIFIPNSTITSGKILNTNAYPTRRIDMVFSISYDDDIKVAKTAIHAVVNADDRILKEPPTVVGVMTLNSSSVDLVVRPWVKTADYWPVHFALNENIKEALEAKGCSIPFPQQDVHVYTAAAKTAEEEEVANKTKAANKAAIKEEVANKTVEEEKEEANTTAVEVEE